MDKKEEIPILLGLAAKWNRAELGREVEKSTRTWSRLLDPGILPLEWNRLRRIRPGENSQCGRDVSDSLIARQLVLNGGAIGGYSGVPVKQWISWLKGKKRDRSRKRKPKTP